MRRREFPDAADAIRELESHGYHEAFVPATMPNRRRWVKKGKPSLALIREARPRSVVFHIVEYPDE
jgi:hypothetical protein